MKPRSPPCARRSLPSLPGSRFTSGSSIPFELEMSSHIVIDARRMRDFAIGTHIRSLVQALGAIDHHNRYTLVSRPDDLRTLTLPENFRTASYKRTDARTLDHVAFPIFLRSL